MVNTNSNLIPRVSPIPGNKVNGIYFKPKLNLHTNDLYLNHSTNDNGKNPYETSRSVADLQQICFDQNRSTADYFLVCRVCFQSAADVKLEYPSRC